MKTLKAELEVARNNISVMSDMMSQMEPGSLEPTDTELLEVGIRHGHKHTHPYFLLHVHTHPPVYKCEGLLLFLYSLWRSVAAVLHEQGHAGPDGGAHTPTDRGEAHRAVTHCQ